MSPADAYLQPIVDKFGEHKGLNADWATMAWLVHSTAESGWWILDDESPEETVSLVTCVDDGDGDPLISTYAQGSVADMLVVAEAIK